MFLTDHGVVKGSTIPIKLNIIMNSVTYNYRLRHHALRHNKYYRLMERQ